MPEPPTPIIHPTATRSERFQRTNGVPAQPPAAPPPPKPKLKKLRLALVFGGLSILALISTVFGMLMAVSSDLPSLENRAAVQPAPRTRCSTRTPRAARTSRRTRPASRSRSSPATRTASWSARARSRPNVKNAVIAIEDRRFYSHKGVDYTGIGARAGAGRAQAPRRPGRLDDHPAVREERARRAGRPLGVPEAARGRARLPPRAQVAEGQDPHPVPQHRLLRERRLRDRGRRAHLLRRRRRARRAGGRRRRRRELHAARRRGGAGPGRARGDRRGAARGRAARRDDRVAHDVRPGGAPAGRHGAPQRGARSACST